MYRCENACVVFRFGLRRQNGFGYNLSRHLVIADSLVNVYISTALIVIAEGMKVTAATGSNEVALVWLC